MTVPLLPTPLIPIRARRAEPRPGQNPLVEFHPLPDGQAPSHPERPRATTITPDTLVGGARSNTAGYSVIHATLIVLEDQADLTDETMRNVRAVLRRDREGMRLSVVFPTVLCDLFTAFIFVTVVIALAIWLGPVVKAVFHSHMHQSVVL